MIDSPNVVNVIQVKYNNLVTEPVDPTKSGYIFKGWYKESTFENLWDFNNDVVTGDTTLYAKWVVSNFNVYFDSVGGSAVAPIKDVTVGSKIAEPVAPTKEGHVFQGWFTHASGGTKWDFTNDVCNSEMTLHAHWEVAQFTVVFNSNGGNGTLVSQGMEYGDSYDLAANTYTRDGYKFIGWSEVIDGDVVYTDKASLTADMVKAIYNKPTIGNKGTYNLYAKWELLTYKITYDLDGGTVSTANPTTYTINDTFTLTNPTKTGYSFVKWTGSKSGKTINITNTFGDLNFKATFSKMNYQFILSVNGQGSVEFTKDDGSSHTVSSSSSYETTLQYQQSFTVTATPADGYIFKGWYRGSNNLVSTKLTETFTQNTDSPQPLEARFSTPELPGAVATKIDAWTIEYGAYPKTKVTDTTLINKLKSAEEDDNTHYYLNDGKYYASIDKTTFFEVEAIRWTICKTIGNNQIICISEDLIEAGLAYGKTAVYKDSYIRHWLNNGVNGCSYSFSVSDYYKNKNNFYMKEGFIERAFGLYDLTVKNEYDKYIVPLEADEDDGSTRRPDISVAQKGDYVYLLGHGTDTSKLHTYQALSPYSKNDTERTDWTRYTVGTGALSSYTRSANNDNQFYTVKGTGDKNYNRDYVYVYATNLSEKARSIRPCITLKNVVVGY